jgi:phage tail sheath gpL-like
MASTAVSNSNVAAVVGYLLAKGNFNTTSPNLPQRIAILGEATTAKQSGLSTAAYEITNAKMAGDAYGYSSPIYAVARILFPLQGGGVNCPVIVYPQAAAGGAVAAIKTITVTGTATGSGTHYLYVAGRAGVDGASYAINIATSDTPTIIAGKIKDAMNNCLSCPMSADNTAGVVTATAEWAGLTSNSITLSVDTNGNALGVSYAVATDTAGSGTPSVATSLALFGEEWNTIVINTYGTVSATMGELETFNGMPSQTNPTGRFNPTSFKPFIALTGSVADDPSSITDARKLNQTIAICPAPLSAGQQYEAAANMAVLWSKCAQDTPELDVINGYYPDMPAPVIGSAAPAMNNYNTRESYVQKGCSTVILVSGVYKVQDFVTTYHPDGEVPPQYRYPRDLNIDFNAEYAYRILVQQYQVGKAIANDNDIVNVSEVCKPKSWKAIVAGMYEDFVKRALFADLEFGKSSIVVTINGTNPNRMDTVYKYKRTGVTRISATTAFAGFNFGN